MTRVLTPERIASYVRLDKHSKEVLRGFAALFPKSTIVWIPTEETNARKEGPVPANGTAEHKILFTEKPTNKKAARASTQMRPFYETRNK
jgi:hypothetical protein